MSTTYTYQREIYDVNGLFLYIQATLPTIQSVGYGAGTIVTYWPAALSGGQQTTLAGLITDDPNRLAILE